VFHFFPDSLADGFEIGKEHRVRFQSFKVSKVPESSAA
jgi:hypothetical protein